MHYMHMDDYYPLLSFCFVAAIGAFVRFCFTKSDTYWQAAKTFFGSFFLAILIGYVLWTATALTTWQTAIVAIVSIFADKLFLLATNTLPELWKYYVNKLKK